jgi:hypothetical protein
MNDDGPRCSPGPVGASRGLEQVELSTLDWVHWFNTQHLLEPLGFLPRLSLKCDRPPHRTLRRPRRRLSTHEPARPESRHGLV